MPPIRPELLDELLKDYKKPDDLLGQDGLLQQLTKALVKRALDGELTPLQCCPNPGNCIGCGQCGYACCNGGSFTTL